MCDDEVTWLRAWPQLRRERIARLRSASAKTRNEEKAAAEIMAARKAAGEVIEFDDDDDDSGDRDEDYYAGFGENSHYMGID